MRNIRATLLSTSRACRSFANFLKKKGRNNVISLKGKLGFFLLLFCLLFFWKLLVRSINVYA